MEGLGPAGANEETFHEIGVQNECKEDDYSVLDQTQLPENTDLVRCGPGRDKDSNLNPKILRALEIYDGEDT